MFMWEMLKCFLEVLQTEHFNGIRVDRSGPLTCRLKMNKSCWFKEFCQHGTEWFGTLYCVNWVYLWNNMGFIIKKHQNHLSTLLDHRETNKTKTKFLFKLDNKDWWLCPAWPCSPAVPLVLVPWWEGAIKEGRFPFGSEKWARAEGTASRSLAAPVCKGWAH